MSICGSEVSAGQGGVLLWLGPKDSTGDVRLARILLEARCGMMAFGQKQGGAGICPERRGGGSAARRGSGRHAARMRASSGRRDRQRRDGHVNDLDKARKALKDPLWIRRVPSGTAGRGGSGAFRTRRARGHAHGGGQVGVLPGAGHRAGRLDAGGESARVAHGRPGAGTAGRRRARRLPQLHAHARAAGDGASPRLGGRLSDHVRGARAPVRPALPRVRPRGGPAARRRGRGALRFAMGPGLPARRIWPSATS